MNNFNLPAPTVVYVMDAYCGWCWGFAERIAEFEAANRHRVDFTAISGGLFVGSRAAPLSDYPHIPEANERISRLTGAVFGDAYQKLLRKGDAVMDSFGAAQGLAVLRAQAPERAIHWAHELQAAFYLSGLSLSDPETIAAIARANGLDESAVLSDLKHGLSAVQAQADFAWVRRLGVASYPTLLFINGSDVQQLPATGTALDVLNRKLDTLLV